MSVTIKDIATTQATLNNDDYFELQENAGTSKKVMWSTMSAGTLTFVGESLIMLASYKAISSSFPYLCMSLPDTTLSTTNYSQAFIDVLRARKIVYDEFNTAVSSFGGAWSGSNFTLTNNAGNIAMVTELYEDWLFAGSPSSGWRILVSGGTEYNITGFTVASRIITVSGSPSGTSIEIYLNRIMGSTTSCKHFSWAGLGLYMTGQNKITGLRRRDKFQGSKYNLSGYNGSSGGSVVTLVSAAAPGSMSLNFAGTGSNSLNGCMGSQITDGANGTPRTGAKTEIESATAMLYLYAGSYV